jgi:hypothetical protein
VARPRVVIAAHFPSSIATSLAGYGVAALVASIDDLAQFGKLTHGTEIVLPALDLLSDGVSVEVDGVASNLRWIASEGERDRWTDAGSATAPETVSATPSAKATKGVRKKSAAS